MKKASAAILICFSLTALVGCHHQSQKKKAADAQAVPVTVMAAKKVEIAIPHKSVGSISSLQNPIIKSQVEGEVTNIYVRAGDAVTKGETLLKLMDMRQSGQLGLAKARLVSAKAQLQEKIYEAKRYKELLVEGATSQLHYEQVNTEMKVAKANVQSAEHQVTLAQQNVDRTVVKAPISGHVEHIFVSVGSFVNTGDTLLKLINRKMLQASLPFSEKIISQFKAGDKVKLASFASPDKLFDGEITKIVPAINPKNRSFNVLVRFSNTTEWHAGASAQAQVYLDVEEHVFIVPKASVILTSKGDFIFIVKAGKAVMLPVEEVYSWGEQVAIDGKIKNGDQIVVHGASYLGNGSPVTIQKTPQKNKTDKPSKPSPQHTTAQQTSAHKSAGATTGKDVKKSADTHSSTQKG